MKQHLKASKYFNFNTMLSLSLVLLFNLISCRHVPVVEVEQQHSDPLKENLINANRIIAQSEETQIDAYVARHGWTMQRIVGGSRIMVTDGNRIPTLNYGDTIELRYSVETIGGDPIYSNLCDTVVVGRAKPNRGVDEALLSLAPHSSAIVIVPSEQGFGVVGDGDRITSRMILVYKITTNNITQQ